MQEHKTGNWKFAPGVRVFATRDGVILSSGRGRFRLSGSVAASFLWEALPALYFGEAGGTGGPPVGWWTGIGKQLEKAAVAEYSTLETALGSCCDREIHVAVSRPTSLALRTLSRLLGFGFRRTEALGDAQFIISDLSGLNVRESFLVSERIHQTGAPSISLWRQGSETFYGPVAKPQSTACWYCFQRRFTDSLNRLESPPAENGEEEIAARIMADNALLAIRYPDIAAYGCVLTEDSETTSLHSVLPMPWCEVCGGAADPSHLTILTNSVHVPEDLRILADSRGGIVRKLLIFESNGHEAPIVPECCSVVMAPFENTKLSNPGFNGEGKGATREDALRGAIGEGVERYAASLWHPSHLYSASFASLGDRAFDPRWLVLYDDAHYQKDGFGYEPFNPDRLLDWTIGQWLDTHQEVRLPAYATYLNFPSVTAPLSQTTSSGLATGVSFEDAALRALYELIERDAFMLSWLTRRPGRRIDPAGDRESVNRALHQVESLGARIEIFLVDVGTGHPTVVCLGFGDGVSWPGVTIGLGTHANIDIALQKAVFEHGHYGAYLRRLMHEGRHHSVRQPSDVLGSLDHGLFYIHPEQAVHLEFFRAGPERPISLEFLRKQYREPATLAACVARLRTMGVRAAAVDITPSDVALAGLRVVRAFGTNLQPIHFGFGYERLNNPRLKALQFAGTETMPHPIA
ncbi:MAG: ribosomal protein methylthiotransferase accessory factor [Verrucomicrobiota bacterium]